MDGIEKFATTCQNVETLARGDFFILDRKSRLEGYRCMKQKTRIQNAEIRIERNIPNLLVTFVDAAGFDKQLHFISTCCLYS